MKNLINELVNLRLAYLKEDFGHLDEKDVSSIESGLPDYFQRHLNQDLFVYTTIEDKKIVSCAFLLLVEKPMSPSFINGKTGIVLNVYTKPECRECFAKFYCSGGCMANSFHATGNINGNYGIGCKLQRKRIECAIMIKAAESS